MIRHSRRLGVALMVVAVLLLVSGDIVDSFNTGTPPNQAVDVIVMP
jgi:hypothetical protein